MSTEATTYTLGATAPALEMIRDFVQSDHEAMQRHLTQALRNAKQTVTWLESLQEKLDEDLKETTLDLINGTLEANAGTTFKND